MTDDPGGYIPADASIRPGQEIPGAALAVPEAAAEEKVYDLKVVGKTAAAAYPGAAVAPAVRAVIAHPVARVAARHGLYVVAGAVVAWRRWRSRKTLTARMAMAAAASGDHEGALKWAQLDAQQRKERHAHLIDRIETVGKTFILLPKMAVGLAVALGVLGLFMVVATRHGSAFLTPGLMLAHAVEFTLAVVSVAWAVVTAAALPAAAAALYVLGRFGGDLAPAWAVTSADGDVDVAIDERAVTQALAALRLPQITEFLKTGGVMPYLVACRQEGRGTYAEVRLPLGLPASEIAKQARRERLAAGLYRKVKEVWPTVGADESILKLWVADKGALEEGAGPYPLLGDGLTDVFKGVPFGKVLRGDPLTAPLMERNTITGGMPGQGKSSATRVIMCGAALDWTAELWIMIPDVNFDFEVMKRRCSRYVMGAEDEQVETIRDWLGDLKDEVQRRGQKLVDFEVPAVTRKLASAGIGLHPMFVLLEEAHVAIQHHIYGKEIAGLLTDIVKLGRKRGIHVIVSTQAPTKDSMPRDVTRNCSNGIAFAVGDHVPNDALLGAGAYRAGHRATELIPGTDRGIAVVKGFSGERSEMVQVYFLDVERGHDQVTPIIDRALAEIARRGKGLPGGPPPLKAIEARDLLDDLAEVLGDSDGRVRLADLPVRLRQLAPSWGRYKTMTRLDLKAQLDREGVRTTNTGNVLELSPADLRAVLADRTEESE